MGNFAYQALDQQGKKVSNTIEASDANAASKQLRQRGLTIVKLEEGKGAVANREIQIRLPWAGVPSGELTLFSRQFATMVGAGLTILRCLMILEEQCTNNLLRDIISEVVSDIEAGRSLSESLEKHPKTFDRLYISMVRAGEIGGVLEMTLQRVASSMEAREALKRKVKSAMMYPMVVLIFAVIASVGMILFLVPIFANMYKDLGSKLPAITQFLVDLSNAAQKQWYLIPVVIATPIVIFRVWKGSEMGRKQWDRIKLNLPMRIGTIVQKLALARFSRTLSSLISSGVPMMQAVQVTGESSGNNVIEESMDDVLRSIEEGRTFSEPLKRHPIYPKMVVQMVSIGEETGKMDAMLEKVAEFYEDEVEAMIKSLTSIIEPIMMIGVGAIVGFFVIALYMPMFQLFDKIK